MLGEVFYPLFCGVVFIFSESGEDLAVGVKLLKLAAEAVFDIDCLSVVFDGCAGFAELLCDLCQFDSEPAGAGITLNGQSGVFKSFV